MQRLSAFKFLFALLIIMHYGCNSSGDNSGCNPVQPVSHVPNTAELNSVTAPTSLQVAAGCTGNALSTFVPRIQQANLWCWAASGEMCMEFTNPGHFYCQFDQADHNCAKLADPNPPPGTFCNNGGGCRLATPTPGGAGEISPVPNCETSIGIYIPAGCCCNNTGWPDFHYYGFDFDSTLGVPLDWDSIKKQISCAQTPIAFSWHWQGSGGHMMVITGFWEDDTGKWLTITDPSETIPEKISYEEYKSVSVADAYDIPSHTHWNDYYNITMPLH